MNHMDKLVISFSDTYPCMIQYSQSQLDCCLVFARQLEKSNFEITPQKSVITGFNGLLLGYAKTNGIQGIGLYGELNEPAIPQYRAAKSIIKTLEKLTYTNFRDTTELDVMADDIDAKIENSWPPKFRQ